jgi:CubicO group peptidase (beta-lactamase class C family)
MRKRIAWLVACLAACSSTPSPPPAADGGPAPLDGGAGADGGLADGGLIDGGASDAGLPPADVSRAFAPIRADAGLPALGGAVWAADRMIALGMTGVRKIGDATAATVDDAWHLGSDTKAMTATLIGLHVDRRDISFDDTVGTLFAGETIDPGYQNVTLEQLLRHRGGAPGDIPADIWARMWSDGSDPSARGRAVLAMLARPPTQAPGTFVYANAGYMMAGNALERRLGATWESLISSELFTPLGMTSCGFGAPGTPNQVDAPWGHSPIDGGYQPISPGPNADNPPSLGPAGTVHCTLRDWGKFLALHLAGARGAAGSLVSQQTMNRLHSTPDGGDYAAGWIVTHRSWAGGDGTTLTHSGSNTLWFATAWLAPGINRTFAVVTNAGGDVAATAVDTSFGPLINGYSR